MRLSAMQENQVAYVQRISACSKQYWQSLSVLGVRKGARVVLKNLR